MNSYAKRMMMERMSDGRNPYGKRGGYADRMDGERSYDFNLGYNYRDGAGSAGSRGDSAYSQSDSARYGRDREHGMGSDGYYRTDGYYGGGNSGMDYGYDMHEHANKLSQKDIKKWSKALENSDGTRGPKYEAHQIMPFVERLGIRFEEYDLGLFTMIVNMMYSDYCKVLGADPIIYVKLAKAFLEDADFSGEPAEKAMLYYKCIVEKDE